MYMVMQYRYTLIFLILFFSFWVLADDEVWISSGEESIQIMNEHISSPVTEDTIPIEEVDVLPEEITISKEQNTITLSEEMPEPTSLSESLSEIETISETVSEEPLEEIPLVAPMSQTVVVSDTEQRTIVVDGDIVTIMWK